MLVRLLVLLLVVCPSLVGVGLGAPRAAQADDARPDARPVAKAEAKSTIDPRFRQGAPSDQLIAGPPHLSRGHLNAFVDLFEAAFDVYLPADIEAALRSALEKSFGKADRGARETFLDLVDNIVEIRRCARCCKNRGVRGCLRAFRRSVDKRLIATPKDPANRILLHVLERRHTIVWLGVPEVKGLAADAYLETVLFVASLGRNEPLKLSPGQQSALRDYLDRDLRRLPERVRDRLALSHRQWLLAKARWDRGRKDRRLAMRWEAVRLMARLVPKTGGHTVGEGASLKAYGVEAERVRAADRGFDAITALARNPELLQQALDRGLELNRSVPTFTFMYR
jgi:hypothetical protein